MTFSTYWNTGTIAISGTAVTGVGTGWSGNIQSGDILWVNGTSCRIATVNSNTSLTLARPWPGAAVPAGSYYEIWIVLDAVGYQQRVKELLEDLNNGNLSALAGLVGMAGKVPMFTGAGTMGTTDLTTSGRSLIALNGLANQLPYFSAPNISALTPLTAAARTILGRTDANNIYGDLGVIPRGSLPTRLWDITAPLTTDANLIDGAGFYRVDPSALNTPVSTWGTILAGAFTAPTTTQIFIPTTANEMYFRRVANGVPHPWQKVIGSNDVIGTVAQSGGTPTGALMERGSNANGYYERFACGTQICLSPVVTTDINIADGTGFRSGSISQAMPATFVGTPTGFGEVTTGVTAGWVNPRTSPGQWQSGAFSNTSRTGITIQFGAIGRWF